LTATNGTSHASANALAADTPISSAPIKPGPYVQATASIRWSSTPASTIARAITGLSDSRWARLAISGTTPPKSAWISIWLDTTLEITSLPPITSAAAGLVAARLDPEHQRRGVDVHGAPPDSSRAAIARRRSA
jgi:hypothetical protein